jgi:hypothetical protein
LKVSVQRLCSIDPDPDASAEEQSKMLDDLMDSPGFDVPFVLSLLAANGPIQSAPTPLLIRLLQKAASTRGTDVAEGKLDQFDVAPPSADRFNAIPNVEKTHHVYYETMALQHSLNALATELGVDDKWKACTFTSTSP